MSEENQSIAVIVPTVRPERFLEWLDAWEYYIVESKAKLYVVSDTPQVSQELEMPFKGLPLENRGGLFSWEDIDKLDSNVSWIFPRKTDCVRSFGYYKAYLDGHEYFVTLDDDVLPIRNDPESENENPILGHISELNCPSTEQRWECSVLNTETRGIPALKFNQDSKHKAMINHGLWNGVLDFAAHQQLMNKQHGKTQEHTLVFRKGAYFPMCGMNLSWRREMMPAMWFLLMGQGWPYDRFGDIWCGLFAKKICDHLGYVVSNGQPHVQHNRASNVFANLRKEAPGMEANEHLWKEVDKVVLTGKTVESCYLQLSEELKCPEGMDADYCEKLKHGMQVWLELLGYYSFKINKL